jgi:hypothetical protein
MWQYFRSRTRNPDLEPVRANPAKELPRTATGQPESPRCRYFEPGGYPSHTFKSEGFELHGFQPDQHALSSADQQTLQRFARDAKKTFETYPESFVALHGSIRHLDSVVQFLTAAELPADKIRTVAHDGCSCTVEVRLFKRKQSQKPGNTVRTKPSEIAVRPAVMPFATLPGKLAGEADEYRGRTKEDSTIAAVIADLHRKQADLPKGARTPSEPLSKGAQQIAEALGLPDWAVEKAREYASQLPAVGLRTVLDHIDADKSLEDRERAALRKLLTALPKITE